jgi:uncharacterized protein YggT (Ycf19 family)
MSFWKILIASSIGQIITWIIVQGFTQSYWGKQAREEISRIFNQMSKHMGKQK